jgi:hypothetical protein
MIIKGLTSIREMNLIRTGSFYTTFDGINESVNLGATDIIATGATQASWSFWIRLPNGIPASNEAVYGSYDSGGTGNLVPLIVANSAGKLVFYLSSGGTNRTSVATIADMSWHHIVCTWKGSMTHNIYIDGVLSNGALAGGSVEATIPTSPIDTEIGVMINGSSSWFDGHLNEIAVYNATLTAGEVTTIYNLGQMTPDYSGIASLVAHWRMHSLNPIDIVGGVNGTSVNMDGSNIIRL